MEKVEVLTAEQERELIAHVDPIGDVRFQMNEGKWSPVEGRSEWKQSRNAVIVLLMSDAGLRVGEVVQLLYSDCYFACRPVLKLKVRAEIAKGGFEREVPLTRRLIFALERFWRGQETAERKVDHDFMITRSRFGERMTTRGVEKFIEKLGRCKLGIKLYPHMLRHTCATKLMRITDMATVQKILGHRHLSSTEIYLHPNSEDLDIAIRGMEIGSLQAAAQAADEKGHSSELQGDNQGETDCKQRESDGDSKSGPRRQTGCIGRRSL